MKQKIAVLLLGIVTLAVSAMAGSKNPMVGGQEMYPTNALDSSEKTVFRGIGLTKKVYVRSAKLRD